MADTRNRRSKFYPTPAGGGPEEGDIVEDRRGRQWMFISVEKKRVLYWTTEVLVAEEEMVKRPDWIERDDQ